MCYGIEIVCKDNKAGDLGVFVVIKNILEFEIGMILERSDGIYFTCSGDEDDWIYGPIKNKDVALKEIVRRFIVDNFKIEPFYINTY